MKKIIDWFRESNRSKHLVAGIIVYVMMLAVPFMAVGFITLPMVVGMAVGGMVATVIAMCTVEYIQKTLGHPWDWHDVLAGTIVPAVITLIILTVYWAKGGAV